MQEFSLCDTHRPSHFHPLLLIVTPFRFTPLLILSHFHACPLFRLTFKIEHYVFKSENYSVVYFHATLLACLQRTCVRYFYETGPVRTVPMDVTFVRVNHCFLAITVKASITDFRALSLCSACTCWVRLLFILLKCIAQTEKGYHISFMITTSTPTPQSFIIIIFIPVLPP